MILYDVYDLCDVVDVYDLYDLYALYVMYALYDMYDTALLADTLLPVEICTIRLGSLSNYISKRADMGYGRPAVDSNLPRCLGVMRVRMYVLGRWLWRGGLGTGALRGNHAAFQCRKA